MWYKKAASANQSPLLGAPVHLRGKGAARPVEDQMENQLLRSEIKELKERIAVLERLATDTHSAAALDREIEKLR